MVWSDLEILGLVDSFVPAADETWRLQRGTDPECRFFQSFADKGHYQEPGATRQGIYTVTPSGELLGSINSLDPRRVEQLLVDSLEKWKTVDDAQKRMPPENELKPDHRWEDSYPEDGLVLRMYTRDLPPDGNPTLEPSLRWNRDHVWLDRDEMLTLIPEEPEPGQSHPIPQPLLERIARFHLVDNVKGQTIAFSQSQVQDSKLTATITSIEGPTIQLHVEGETLGNAPGPRTPSRGRRGGNANRAAHGVRMLLAGEATFDTGAQTFTAFDLTGIGTRWGRTENNGRARELDPTPIGVTFELAPKTEAAKVGPAFVGPEYADWIELPEGMRRR